MIINKYKYLYISVFLVLITFGCKNNRFNVPVSEVELELSIQRFENDLFSIRPNQMEGKIPELQRKYGDFLTVFGYVINIGDPSYPEYAGFLQSFVTNHTNSDVYQKVQREFSDFGDIENKLISGFMHYKYYFPQKSIPDIYTFVSGFNNSIVIDENILGIGLDRYLGQDCKYYKELGIPGYLSKKMIPGKIPADCFYAWGKTEFSLKGNKKEDISDNVLNNIIYEGKLKYFTRAMLPEEPEELIFGFTEDQLKWCEENEAEIWTYLVENKILYKTDYLTIRKLTGDAPFTSFFPKESPGQAAVWLGYRIVLKYMDNKTEETLPELMENSDYQNILRISKYNPQ
jgi:hypothetical protein